jgi:hypothetical protein
MKEFEYWQYRLMVYYKDFRKILKVDGVWDDAWKDLDLLMM